MQKPDRVRLQQMLDAAQAARRFAQNRRRDDLDTDQQLVFALVKAIEIIGEAAARLTPELKTQADQIPWRDVVAMRNRHIHAYFDINLNILYRTVQTDLPQLISVLSELLKEEAP